MLTFYEWSLPFRVSNCSVVLISRSGRHLYCGWKIT
jgi:hypothetical protein